MITFTITRILFTGKIYRVSRKKTDTIIFCYNSENKHSAFRNDTCLYSQKHGTKTDDRCHVACTPPGQSQQLFKEDARCEPRSLHARLRRKNDPTTPLSCSMVIQAVTFWEWSGFVSTLPGVVDHQRTTFREFTCPSSQK